MLHYMCQLHQSLDLETSINRYAEALLGISTLMPHLRGVVRGGVGHRLPKGMMPHVLTTCTLDAGRVGVGMGLVALGVGG